MSIKRIMLAIAPDQEVNEQFQQILSCADKFKATVQLFSVVDDLTPSRVANHLRLSPWALLEMAKDMQLERLAELAKKLNKSFPNIQFEYNVASGMAFVQIISAADLNNIDLIAVTAHQRQVPNGLKFGSTARHLMRKAPIPVWALTDNQHSVRRIAAAVDVDSPSEEGMLLNESIVKNAAMFAELLDSDLYLVHAWRLVGEGYLRTLGNHSPQDLRQLAEQIGSSRERAVNELAQMADRLNPHVSLVQGIPQVSLAEFVKAEKIDLLTMGTVCRTDMRGLIIGNTAESLLDAISCSALTLKPENFKSPVLGQ